LYFCAKENVTIMNRLLEICADSIGSAQAAWRGGADRLELCQGLDEGGVTPSYGYVKAAVQLPNIRKNVLIRPRGGDFIYTPAEAQVMIDDIRVMKQLGVDGVVIGALNTKGEIDLPLVEQMIAAADGMEVTFHRAFDMCVNPSEALEQLITMGCHRVLTSGCSATALAGVARLRDFVQQAQGRISIMPGCGVKSSNAAEILSLCGATEIHASARAGVESASEYRLAGVEMGAAGRDEYYRMETSADEVRGIKTAISAL
jgi:copper homeostasis protein